MATTPTDPGTARPAVLVSGYLLRVVLLLTLRRSAAPLSVEELVTRLEGDGFRTRVRPSKAVSDALRWEVRRGRVRRIARSTYAVGLLPRQTAWRMQRRLDDHVSGWPPG